MGGNARATRRPPRSRRLGAGCFSRLEADVTSAADEWLERLLRPVLEQKADLVVPVYARHRYDGTITNLVLAPRSEEHTSELQSQSNLVCRLLLEKKKINT